MSYAFISYSRSDADYVQKLVDKLHAEGFEIWIDQRINTGTKWFQEIEKAILGSAAFVLVMTPASYESEWVQKEVIIALDESKPIFPLLLDGRRFGILADVQFKNVMDGKLPAADFYDDLAKVIPRGQSSSAPPVVTPQTISQEIKPSGAPLPYVPSTPGYAEQLRHRGLLEEKIKARLNALFEATPVGVSGFRQDLHCVIGRVFVFRRGDSIRACIVFTSLDAATTIPSKDWRLAFIERNSELAAYAGNGLEGVATLRDKYCLRRWSLADYEGGLRYIARDIIDANLTLGLTLQDIVISCVGI